MINSKKMEDSHLHTFKELQRYLPLVLAALIGATAHALEEVRKRGWSGWVAFFSDIFVCMFIGWLFYQLAAFVVPAYAVFACSVGAYWGTKGFVFIREWFINSLKANLPK